MLCLYKLLYQNGFGITKKEKIIAMMKIEFKNEKGIFVINVYFEDVPIGVK